MDALVDELCRRRCAFAYFAQPGGSPVFCMRKDGAVSPWRGQAGFLLSPWCGEPFCIEPETKEPVAEDFPLLPETAPQDSATTRERYGELFRTYTSWFTGKDALGKVVLARTQDEPVPPDFSPAKAFRTACRLYPGAFNALVHTPQFGTWLCSTPEVLVRGMDECMQTMALAGTRPVGTPGPWDAKNTEEHAMVARHIQETLTSLGYPPSSLPTETLAAGQVEHLCKQFFFPMPQRKLPSLLRALAPTPAVAGFPVKAAVRRMAACPDVDRALYAGYMGPYIPESSSLYVTLRCMRIYPGVCRLYAGGGLTPDSGEETEWLETLAKLRTMQNVLEEVENPLK